MIVREKNKIKNSNSRTQIAYQRGELELEKLRMKLNTIQHEIDLLEQKQKNRLEAIASMNSVSKK